MNEQNSRLTPEQVHELHACLATILREAAAQSGTIHLLDPASGLLRLAAHTGIPAPVLEKIAAIPVGKGLAGLAAQRLEPVQVCNLQTDASGVARPGARATGAQGAVAVPIFYEAELRGVLGVAKSTPHEWNELECRHFLQQGLKIVEILEKKF